MDDRPRLSARLVAGLTVALTALLMLARLLWVEPWLRAPGVRTNGQQVAEVKPEGLVAMPFAVLLALGLAVVIGLAVANRSRWRAVVRPNWGRVIGAIVLAFVTPLAVYEWVPFIIGTTAAVFGLGLLVGGQFVGLLMMIAALLVVIALWYPVACLIVSGIRGRMMRVAIFALMFWAAYSAVILVVGAGSGFAL